MMPLILSKAGEESVILRVGGSLLNVIGGNLIVKVKESRVAISREMAQKIMVQ